MLKLLPLAFAFVVLQPTTQPSATTALPSLAEFPAQDSMLRFFVEPGALKRVAARRLAEDPDSVETARLLAQARDLDGMLRALRAIVDKRPDRIRDAFKAVGDALFGFGADDERTAQRRQELERIVADARKKLPGLPREDAARAERVFSLVDGMLSRERDGHVERLSRLAEQYRGTETALVAEVEILGNGRVSQGQFDALDKFIAEHPGTTAAARALFDKGFDLHTINTLGTLYPRGADPTSRFLRVLEIVKELESGRYPPSEWVQKAPSLVIGFYMDEAKIAPENVDRMIEGYTEFVRTHFSVDAADPGSNGIGYVILSKIAALLERQGERVAGIERLLASLERTAADPSAVRYLKGVFYLKPDPRDDRHQPMLEQARAVLAALADEGTGLYHRRALATVAMLDFEQGDCANARAGFRRYATAYPESSWGWVAWLRAGKCEEELGDPNAAAAAYLEAAKRYSEFPPAVVLGHEYAARAYEAAGEFSRALQEHRRALAGWDDAWASWRSGTVYSIDLWRQRDAVDPFVPRSDPSQLRKEALAARLAELEASLALPEGARLERGRWLIANGRQSDAVKELQRLLAEHPDSRIAPAARALLNRARLDRALDLADVQRSDTNEPAALNELEALGGEPVDFAVTAARIARASILWKNGEADEAEEVMLDALSGWHAAQRISAPKAGLETEVAEIQRAVFLPAGGRVYGSERWNAFSWPTSLPSFALVNRDIPVLTHDGAVTTISLAQSLPGGGKVLFFDGREIDFLQQLIVRLGGTRRREPTHLMETPNQPVGDSMQILRLWSKFFPARPGHWGGWEILTYPVITQIEFTNAERTKAAAKVTVGYSGATVELEKEGGQWIAKRLTNRWIT